MINATNLSVELYQELLQIAASTLKELSTQRICESLVENAQRLTSAQGGSLYLVEDDASGVPERLTFAVARNDIIDLSSIPELPSISLWDLDGNAVHSNIASCTFHHAMLSNVSDIYCCEKYDFSGTYQFDKAFGYQSESIIAVPLIADTGKVVGIFQLINCVDEQGNICAFSSEQEQIGSILAEFTANALEKQLIERRQQDLLAKLSVTGETSRIAERILKEAKLLTCADGGTLYLKQEKEGQIQLEFIRLINDSLQLDLGAQGEPIDLAPLVMFDENGRANDNNVATASAIHNQIYNIKDAYTDQHFDFSGTRAFDAKANYRSKSLLTVPLVDHDSDIIGVLQLVNARDPRHGGIIPFSHNNQVVVTALSVYAAVALNNRILVNDLHELLNAFIQCIAQAIDAKSQHTSGHCQRVPLLTELIAQAACEDEGLFSDFNLNKDEWYELKVASWLHDCGKLATPDSVLDKSTKLHLMHDVIDEIDTRIAVCIAAEQRQAYQKLLQSPQLEQRLLSELSEKEAALRETAIFLRRVNTGGEYLSQEDKQRVIDAASITWPDAMGNMQPLLTQQEVEYLCIERGTLSTAERQIINDHMVVTIDMLESLPFPKKLRRVPEYAGGHHEKMDGTGFPRGLTRDEMSIPARMMAVADIFEALTARDRPYKEPMKLSKALTIMRNMRDNDHIDPDIYHLFVHSRVWEKYANEVLLDEQKDISDIQGYI